MSSVNGMQSTEEVSYQYNKTGNVRAPVLSDMSEVMLDVKLVAASQATPEYLATLNGAVAEARAAGLTVEFRPAQDLRIETFNEITGQWRALPASGAFAVVASLPM